MWKRGIETDKWSVTWRGRCPAKDATGVAVTWVPVLPESMFHGKKLPRVHLLPGIPSPWTYPLYTVSNWRPDFVHLSVKHVSMSAFEPLPPPKRSLHMVSSIALVLSLCAEIGFSFHSLSLSLKQTPCLSLSSACCSVQLAEDMETNIIAEGLFGGGSCICSISATVALLCSRIMNAYVLGSKLIASE